MNAVQVHLALNHFPIVGALFLVATLGYALAVKNAAVWRFGLLVAVVVALSTIPVAWTGGVVEERIEHLAGTSKSFIEPHESMAWLLAAMLGLLGLASVVMLVTGGRGGPAHGWKVALFVLAIVTSMIGVWTGHLGGQIRHPEGHAGAATALEPMDE